MRKLNTYTPQKLRRIRKLPHWQRTDAAYFITFRLNGSLPKEVIETLKDKRYYQKTKLLNLGFSELEIAIKLRQLYEVYFGKFDNLLDHSTTGPHHLKNDSIAKIIADAIMYFNNERYVVINFCIMSNHVHLIFCHLQDELENILESIKKFSARKSNQVLGLTGTQFWHHYSYDHIIRGEAEMKFYIQYNLLNPVKAKLIQDWRNWKWSYIHEDFKKYAP
ncbi:MAG: transposase [Saprospiraceae bacterium]